MPELFMVWTEACSAPMAFTDEDKAHDTARLVHGQVGRIDPRTVVNYGFIQITDTQKLEGVESRGIR